MFTPFLYTNNARMKSALLVGVPLVLASFTHLWNPIGFPSIYVDEAHYMRRAMNVLHGLGPQESENIFYHPYDHPYFGQIFLASILGVVGYPNSLSVSNYGDIHYFESMYIFPRILMGILAVVDTFIIYKIAESRYNRKVAFIASLLFAVMPLGWFIRRIWLESIQLPLLLLSILFIVRCTKNFIKRDDSASKGKENILPVLISGSLLGLTIFTKVPAFTMIPLVGYLVYTTYNRNRKILGIWFIPIILISLFWPAYAMYLNQFDRWYEDVFWQASRTGEGDTVSQVLVDLLKIDPVLFVLGTGGLVLSVVKRDLFLFLWILPYMIFSYIVVHSSYWYFIPLLPALCIGAARLIAIATNLIRKQNVQQVFSFGIVTAIGIFGLISTTILVTTNVTSSYFKAEEFIAQSLPIHNGTNSNKVLVTGGVGLATFTWIPTYVLGMNHDFRMLQILFSNDLIPTGATKALFVVDMPFYNTMTALINIQRSYDLGSLLQILRIYNTTKTTATFTGNADTYDTNIYPYFSMKFNNQLTPSGPDRIEVRANFQPEFLNRTK